MPKSEAVKESRDRAKRKVADCTYSLSIAIQEAGGNIAGISLDMTLRDFIAEVAAQNNIRFVFRKDLSEGERLEGLFSEEDDEQIEVQRDCRRRGSFEVQQD